jgi:hypothetical protein
VSSEFVMEELSPIMIQGEFRSLND